MKKKKKKRKRKKEKKLKKKEITLLIFWNDVGYDYTLPQNQLPVFADKVATKKYLEEKAKEGKISYTLFVTGHFLDWSLATTFLGNSFILFLSLFISFYLFISFSHVVFALRIWSRKENRTHR